jgi:predicted nucleotidyltransferase
MAALYLFSSHARGEAQPRSDVDAFVDPASDDRFGFLQFMDAYEAIRKAVREGVEVGYSTPEGLSPYGECGERSRQGFLMAATSCVFHYWNNP